MSYDPYEILGIDYTATYQELRTAFKKKALEHHPDKGGSRYMFSIIKQAYVEVSKIMEDENKLNKRSSMSLSDYKKMYNKSEESDINPQQIQYIREQMKKDPKLFNKMFEETKVQTYKDHGYNLTDHNQMEELIRSRQDKLQRNNSLAVSILKEPMGVSKSSLLDSCEKFGVDRLDDYNQETLGNNYTDLVDGYLSTDIVNIEVPEERLREFKSVEEYMAFSNKRTKEPLSQEKIDYMREQELKEKRREKLRQINELKNLESGRQSTRNFLNYLTYKK